MGRELGLYGNREFCNYKERCGLGSGFNIHKENQSSAIYLFNRVLFVHFEKLIFRTIFLSSITLSRLSKKALLIAQSFMYSRREFFLSLPSLSLFWNVISDFHN